MVSKAKTKTEKADWQKVLVLPPFGIFCGELKNRQNDWGYFRMMQSGSLSSLGLSRIIFPHEVVLSTSTATCFRKEGSWDSGETNSLSGF